MKLLFVSQYFYPEDFRGNDIVFDLQKRGHQVSVLTGIPNYPAGRFFPNFGFFKNNDEVIHNIKIYRSKLLPRGNHFLSLILNYISFPFFSYFKIKQINEEYDLIVVQQLSPVLMVLPALWFKEKKRIPMVSWVLDLWPESLTATTPIKKGIIVNLLNRLVKRFYKMSDLILISSENFRESILGKDADAAHKIEYFPNWAEDAIALAQPSTLQSKQLPRGFNVVFAGNIGESQDFESILNAAEISLYDEINWIIIGDGRKFQWVKEQVHSRKLTNVFLLGRHPISEMPSFFKQADVMLVSLKSDPIYGITVPAKIQAYMACGKIIVGMLNGEGNYLINQNGIGYAVESGNYKGLVEKIKIVKQLSEEKTQELERKALTYYEENFSKKNLLDKFEKLLQMTVKKL
ncbi:MAG: glycosyltransferase family 4 protein [Leadbetterella sp.]|nr:glycosyltransferase family 4 protein [Leadbetterella sp.]